MRPGERGPGSAPASGAGTSLLLPEVQSTPLPITRIKPAPCSQACPAGVNVKAYVSLIAEGRIAEALEVVRRNCPLPSVCGRVCHHPCELACVRASIDQPVAIRALKRFVADAGLAGIAPDPVPPVERAEKVAVVGSGPAGLTAAYDLRLSGYPVTVFESAPRPGGMLRYGIADYRLPPDVLDAEIEVLCRTGIELRTDAGIAGFEEVEALLADGYDAVLLALGAQRGRNLGIAGEDTDGVASALDFLRKVNEGDRERVPERVVVVGGGSTAVEAARAALRLGAAEVEIVYRRSRREMPAGDEEIAAAEAEGVRFRFLASPTKIVTKAGAMEGLECLQVALGEPGPDGRRRPLAVPGTEFVVPAGLVLAAVGQEAEPGFVPDPLVPTLQEAGLLVADPDSAMTPHAGVFAAGDVVSGPATVIEAIAAGHRAAQSIIRYLEEGTPGVADGPAPAVEYGLADPPPAEAGRTDPATLLPTAGREFAEVEQPYDLASAVAEAGRCLRCGPCSECAICAPACPRRHVLVSAPGGDGPDHWLRLRVPGGWAAGLPGDSSVPGMLRGCLSAAELPVEAAPIRVGYVEDRCRGCSLCLGVCGFGALRRADEHDPESKVTFDAGLCRGCALCTVVCPTGALVSSAFSPAWWAARLAGISGGSRPDGPPAHVLVACESQASSLEAGDGTVVLRFPCAGGVHSGMLLDLLRAGVGRVEVAGCADGGCRYEGGAALWRGQLADARALLRVLGEDEERIAARPPVGRVLASAGREAAP